MLPGANIKANLLPKLTPKELSDHSLYTVGSNGLVGSPSSNLFLLKNLSCE